MDSKTFISNALKTEYTPTSMPINKAGLSTALTMAIACADVVDQLKKLIIYGKKVDVELMRSRLDSMCLAGDFLVTAMKGDGKPECDGNDVNIRLLHAAIGMFTESGELLSALQHQLAGEGLDLVNFAEEIGDVDWYKAIAHDELNISEEQIRTTLIAKLAVRYPGKFTNDGALNRDLDAERKVLIQMCEGPIVGAIDGQTFEDELAKAVNKVLVSQGRPGSGVISS